MSKKVGMRICSQCGDRVPVEEFIGVRCSACHNSNWDGTDSSEDFE